VGYNQTSQKRVYRSAVNRSRDTVRWYFEGKDSAAPAIMPTGTNSVRNGEVAVVADHPSETYATTANTVLAAARQNQARFIGRPLGPSESQS
jgi:hypothetical protein